MSYIKFPAGVFINDGDGPIQMPPGKFIFSGPLICSRDCFTIGAAIRTDEDNSVDFIETATGD